MAADFYSDSRCRGVLRVQVVEIVFVTSVQATEIAYVVDKVITLVGPLCVCYSCNFWSPIFQMAADHLRKSKYCLLVRALIPLSFSSW